MERDTVSPPKKKWVQKDVIALFEQGKTIEEIKKITGLPGRVVGGMKGYLRSPMYDGPPIPPDAEPAEQESTLLPPPAPLLKATTPSRPNGGPTPPAAPQVQEPPVSLEAGPAEAQALSVLLGKPYLIRVQNVYVSPDALKCYQVLVARGFKGSVGDFFELCVLKAFKELWGLVPGMIKLEEQQQ